MLLPRPNFGNIRRALRYFFSLTGIAWMAEDFVSSEDWGIIATR